MVLSLESEYTPLILNRVSTTTQLDGLRAQADENKKMVKERYGFSKTPVEIIQQESGKKQERQSLDDAIAIIKANPKKNYTLFVRDMSRLGRDVPAARALLEDVNALGVSVYIIDSNLHMTGQDGDYNEVMLFTILAAIAEGAKGGEEAASKAGTKRSRKKGIFSGGIKESWKDKITTKGKRKGKSMHRLIWEDIPSNENGITTNKGLARDIKMTPIQTRTIRKVLRELEVDGGVAKVEEYLNFWDAVIAAEKTKGVGSRDRPKSQGGMTARANALHRVTVAYIQDPMNWPDPNTVGNPDTALASAPSEATGTIQDALDNYVWYYKKQSN